MTNKTITAEELDRKFDNGEDITDYIDVSSRRSLNPDTTSKRITVDMPAWLVHSLDNEAQRLCVTRQSVIKHWLADKVNQLNNLPT